LDLESCISEKLPSKEILKTSNNVMPSQKKEKPRDYPCSQWLAFADFFSTIPAQSPKRKHGYFCQRSFSL
jgi:hypothetical protein